MWQDWFSIVKDGNEFEISNEGKTKVASLEGLLEWVRLGFAGVCKTVTLYRSQRDAVRVKKEHTANAESDGEEEEEQEQEERPIYGAAACVHCLA